MTASVLVKRIIEAYRQSPADLAWREFLDDPAPELADLQAVFRDLHNRHLAPAERWWVDRIEQRRAELLTNSSELTYRDFGAGDPEAPRSGRQLHEGVVSDRRVCDLARASVPEEWGLVLFALVRRFEPGKVIELGSALGISGAYQAAALSLNVRGHMYTLEGCPEMARRARQTLEAIDPQRVTVIQGRFQDTLDGVLDRMQQVDFAFVDGHHDEHATLDYWGRISRRLTLRSVVVFDDIDWSTGMRRAWKAIRVSERVSCSIDLGKLGCCLCRDAAFDLPRHFDLPYPCTKPPAQ